MNLKLLPFFLPILTACGHQAMQLPPATAPIAAEQALKPGQHIMSGHTPYVSWQCQVLDFNQSLIWMECDFINVSNRPAEACLQISISDQGGNELDRSRKVCSNVMQPGGSYENYASFVDTSKNKRRSRLTQTCGVDSGRCHLTVEKVSRQ